MISSLALQLVSYAPSQRLFSMHVRCLLPISAVDGPLLNHLEAP